MSLQGSCSMTARILYFTQQPSLFMVWQSWPLWGSLWDALPVLRNPLKPMIVFYLWILFMVWSDGLYWRKWHKSWQLMWKKLQDIYKFSQQYCGLDVSTRLSTDCCTFLVYLSFCPLGQTKNQCFVNRFSKIIFFSLISCVKVFCTCVTHFVASAVFYDLLLTVTVL